jgi:hypothetical protein
MGAWICGRKPVGLAGINDGGCFLADSTGANTRWWGMVSSEVG